MTDFLSLLGLNGGSKVEQKAAEVEVKSQAKQAAIDPQETHRRDYLEMDDPGYAAKYGAVAALRRNANEYRNRQTRDIATIDRSLPEHITDGLLEIGRTAANTVTGLPAMAAEGLDQITGDVTQAGHLADVVTNSTAAMTEVMSPGIAETKHRQVFGKLADKMIEAGATADQVMAASHSDVYQVNQQLENNMGGYTDAQHRREEQAALDAGGNPIVAGGVRLAKDLGSGAVNTHPTTLSSQIVGQAPMLLLGPAARALTSEEAIGAAFDKAVLKQVAKRQVEAATASESSVPVMSRAIGRDALLQEARLHAQERTLIGLNTAAEATGAYQQTAASVLNTPIDQLMAQNPEAKKRIEAGEDPELVRSELAHSAAAISAAVDAPIAALSSKASARFELSPMTGGLEKSASVARRVAEVPANMAKEAVEETGQGAGGQFAQNVGEQATGNTQVDLLDGVGAAAGQGLAIGALSAGAFQAPGLHAAAVSRAADTAKDLGKAGFAAVGARADRVRADVTQQSEQQRAEHLDQVQQVADAVATTLPQAPIPEAAAPVTAPAVDDTVLSPETKASLGFDAEPALTRAQGLGRVLAAFHDPNVSDERKGELAWYGIKVARELRDALPAVAEAHDNAQNPQEQAHYAQLGQLMHGLVNAPLVQHLEQVAANQPEERLQAEFAKITDATVDPEMPMAPDVHQAVQRIREMGYVAPDSVPADVAAKAVVLLQKSGDLTPNDKVQLELAQSLSQLQQDHAAALSKIQTQYPSKGTSGVRQEILETGFDTGTGRLKSVSDHVRAVVQAMTANEPAVGQSALANFAKFAQHMADKASTFDQAMGNLVATDEDRATVPYKTLNADGKLTDAKPAFLDRHSEGSHALIDTIFADAQSVAGAYTALAGRYKELQGKKVPAQITAPSAPTWKSVTPGSAVAQETQTAVAATPPEASHTTRTPAAPAPVESAPAPVREAPTDASAHASAPADGATVATQDVQASDAPVVDNAAASSTPVQPEVKAPDLAVDFSNPAHASPEELKRATSMSDSEYLAAVNPTGKITEVPSDTAIDAELDDTEPSSRATVVGQHGDVTLKADGDYLYAMRGDQTVGLLVSKAEGSQLYVRSTERKNGLGRALVRELLVRKPFAPSNGLSGAAQNTRLSVLRALRAETASRSDATAEGPAAPAENLKERFPGLMDNVAKGLAGQNQFLKAFQAAKGSALFARLASPMSELSAALQKGLDGLRTLLPENLRHLVLSDTQIEALQTLVDNAAPGLVNQLNQNLQNAAEGKGNHFFGKARTGQGFLARLFQDPGKEWTYRGRESLHATQWDEASNTIQYQPRIAQGMALAGLSWALGMINNPVDYNADKVEEKFPGLTDDQKALFQTAHFYEQPVRNLANHLTEVLGLKPNPDAPITQHDGIAKALAADIVAALRDLKVLDLQSTKLESGKVLSFISFNHEADTADGALQMLRNQIDSAGLMTRILAPNSADLPSVGEASTQIASRASGTDQLLSKTQRENLRVLQQTPFTRNVPFHGLLQKLGADTLGRYLGYTHGDLNEVAPNATHRRKVAGKNAGVKYTIQALNELMQLQEQHAQVSGVEGHTVPLFYRYAIDSNGRMRALGFGPQSDKLAREVLTPGSDISVDPKNQAQLNNLYLRVAQALGIKTEQKTNAAAVAEVQALLEQPEHKALLKDLATLEKGEADDTLAGQVIDQMQALKYDTVRALHALHTVVRLQNHEGETFTHRLAFELDGKTDGPINALMQFGLHKINDRILKQLAQGGIFINDVIQNTLNAHGSALGDLYGNATNDLQIGTVEQYKNASIEKRQVIHAALKMLQAIGVVESSVVDEKTTFEIKRGAAKHGVMATIYGSAEPAIVKQQVRTILDKMYEQISNAKRDNTTLPEATIQQLEALMGQFFNKTSGRWVDVRNTMPNLRDNSTYADLVFSERHINNMVDNLRQTVGGLMVNSIRRDMEPVLSSFDLLYKSTALQVFALRKAFNEARETKRQELIATGKLLPNDSLSRNQEQEILAGLRHLMPAFALRQTEANDRTQGVTVGNKGQSGEFNVVNPKGETVTAKSKSITGGLGMDLNVTDFEMPGVASAASLNLGLGDASMMSQMFEQHVRNLLNVYDGLEVYGEDLKAMAEEVNTAVAKGYQYNGLQAAADNFSTFQMDVSSLSDNEAALLADQMRLELGNDDDETSNPGDMLRTKIAEQIQSLRGELAGRAQKSAAIRQAIFELPVAIDHMSGGEQPFVNNETSPVADPVSWIEQRAQSILAEQRAAAEPTAPAEVAGTPEKAVNPGRKPAAEETPALFQRLGLADGRLASLDRTELQILMSRYPFSSALHKFLWSSLEKLLPSNLQVFVGSPEQLMSKQRELFPNEPAFPFDKAVGAYWDGTLFLSRASEETLLHELVHAGTYATVLRYYQGAKGLSASQRDAVRNLETLAHDFLSIGNDPGRYTSAAAEALRIAQGEVQRHIDGGHMAGAVQELLAWTLANPDLAQAMHDTQGSNKIVALAKRVLAVLRKVLELPNNPSMETFLSQTLGQFHRLARRAVDQNLSPALTPGMDQVQLFQALSPAAPMSAPHALHLQDLAKSFNTALTVLSKTGREASAALPVARVIGWSNATQATNDFLAAGFPLNDAEQHLFKLAQALMASGVQLDSATLHAFQEIYDVAMPQLKPEDFLDDPADTSQAAFTKAHQRMDALQQVRYSDAAGRSNLLANFVALGLVYGPLREKLATLNLPKATIDTSSLDARLQTAATATLDKLEQASLKLNTTASLRDNLDLLALRLGRVQEAGVTRAESLTRTTWIDEVENRIKQKMGGVSELAINKLQARQAEGLVGGVNGWINGMLATVHALGSEPAATAFGEKVIELANNASLPTPLRSLIGELIGRLPSNKAVLDLLSQSKYLVAQARQRLREEAPREVRAFFKQKLSKDQWAALHTAVGKTDLQVLAGYGTNTLRELVLDPATRSNYIAGLENQLQALAPGHMPAWREGSQMLAQFLMTGVNEHELLSRNASAIARRAGQAVTVDPKTAQKAAGLIDKLTTLHAVDMLSKQQSEILGTLLKEEGEGMDKLMTLMRSLTRNELNKPGAIEQRYNRWKGYLPTSWDPRRDVVLASDKTGAELLKRGYKLLGNYAGDIHDPLSGLAYYTTTLSGGEGTYNQGAMQTVESTVSGVDKLTGRTIDRNVKTMIEDARTVEAITRAKRKAYHSGQSQRGFGNLIPIYDDAGHIRAYERVLRPDILDNHLRGQKDLSQSIGMWLGRQAEEMLATEVNRQLVDVMKNDWEEGVKTNRESEFVDLAHAAEGSVLRASWDAIPAETQRMLKSTFGSNVMVRRNMLDNTVGYRSASVGNIFTGQTELDPKVRKALEDVAFFMAGKKAYSLLTQGEKIWQGLVSHSKEWIVVRSGVVAFANAMGNQLQLLQMGVPLTSLVRLQATAVREAEQQLRGSRRLAQIAVERSAATSPGVRAQLEREGKMIQDNLNRLSIAPLIAAGELPTIGEGLSEHDEYSILKDGTQWIQDHLDKLPPAVNTAIRYASVSKDTALYQGLNRMIQFGDFMAKYALYQTMVAKGMQQDEALGKISESFVNYNFKAGRTRDYLESMGITWFYNYKLRIQKIVLRNLRENPLRFLTIGSGAGVIGQESLLSSSVPATNWAYGFGLGQFFRAHNMVLWNQLLD